ncbi:hypothetical protein PR003_g26035, partial [Phytophthora rubi]
APPMALQSVDTSGVFDPYETLRVSDSTFSRQIKKAFRALDRQLHPDNNLHNLRAAAQFMRVTKAYEALPDTHCADNYHDCGSPRPHAGAKEDTPKLQGDLAGKMSVYDVVELLLSCDEMVGSAAGILDETKNAMREDP